MGRPIEDDGMISLAMNSDYMTDEARNLTCEALGWGGGFLGGGRPTEGLDALWNDWYHRVEEELGGKAKNQLLKTVYLVCSTLRKHPCGGANKAALLGA